MTEMIVYLTLFLVVWFALGFIGAGYMFSFWTNKFTSIMLMLNKEKALEMYADDRKGFFIDCMFGAVCLVFVLFDKKNRSYGWMFPWSKKTKEYLGIE
jgi:hypothetical protein